MALSLLAANNAQTVLAAGISSTATSLTVNAGTGTLFPSPVAGSSFFKLTIIDAATGSLTEIIHVTARAGDVFTIQRGQEGTVPRAWSANDIAANMMTAGTLSYILGNFQPLDPTLTALAALVGVANKLPYFNGYDTAALTDLTQVGRDIIGKSTIADILTYLSLGTAATSDVTTSKIDNTPSRVLKVGDFGLGTQTYGVIPDSRMVSERAGYGVSFSRVYKSPDTPRMDTYYNLLMLPDTINGAFSALAMSNNETPIYRAYGVGSNNSTNWVKIYDEKNKPTSADIGALPTSGGKVTGPLEIESTSPTIQFTETDTGKKYFIVVDNGNIRLNQDTLSGVNSILSFDATTKDWTLPGGVIPKKYDNFLSLFQKINQASPGTNGWFKDTNTGLIIQWGIGGGEGAAKNYPIQFPIAFPNRCINIQVTLQSSSWDANSGSAMGQIINNTQAYCWSTHSFFWFAIGY